jgi:hypothetical protein
MRMLIAALKKSVKSTTAIPRAVTGNGNGSVNGRGLKHRKATQRELTGLAADVVTGVKHLDLSRGQLCSVLGVTPAALRAELGARALNERDTLTAMAAELVGRLGLDGAFDLLVEVAER